MKSNPCVSICVSSKPPCLWTAVHTLYTLDCVRRHYGQLDLEKDFHRGVNQTIHHLPNKTKQNKLPAPIINPVQTLWTPNLKMSLLSTISTSAKTFSSEQQNLLLLATQHNSAAVPYRVQDTTNKTSQELCNANALESLGQWSICRPAMCSPFLSCCEQGNMDTSADKAYLILVWIMFVNLSRVLYIKRIHFQ